MLPILAVIVATIELKTLFLAGCVAQAYNPSSLRE